MAPKKSVKMDLGSFLADDSLGGSWADGEIDMASIGVPVNNNSTSSATTFSLRRAAESSSFGREDFGEQRRERQEYPIPDAPPYRARVGNLPWEATEQLLIGYFETKLGAQDIVSDVKLPVDTNTGRLRGFGFLTFATREDLEEGLRLSSSEFNGRRIYVDVAAPERQDVFDMDWRGGRGSGLTSQRGGDRGDRGDRPPRAAEQDLDWGSARGSGVLPPREPRGDRPPRREREEPNLDWSSARGTGVLPPREPRTDRPPRREKVEADLDWSSARGTGTLPPREPRGEPREGREPRVARPKKNEPDLDWGSARGSNALPPRQPRATTATSTGEPKAAPADSFDWKRGQALEPKATTASSTASYRKKQSQEEEKPEKKQQKSAFDVLRIDSDEENEDDEEEKGKTAAEVLSEKVSDLSV